MSDASTWSSRAPGSLLHPPGRRERGPYESLNLGILTDDEPDRVVREPRPAGRAAGARRRAHRDGLAGARRPSSQDWTAPPAATASRAGPSSRGRRPHHRASAASGCWCSWPTACRWRWPAPGRVAMLHCGWRGLAGGIIAQARRALRRAAGRRHRARASGAAATRWARRCWRRSRTSRAPRDGRMLDLRAVAEAKLRAAGVDRVEHVDLCTSCHADLFFSHRRDNGVTGRQGGMAWRTHDAIHPDRGRARNLERVRERRIGPDVEILRGRQVRRRRRAARAGRGAASRWWARTAPRSWPPSRTRTATCSSWDFIGALQSRKVKDVAPRVRLIHSVASDSALAQLEQTPRRGARPGERGGGGGQGRHRARRAGRLHRALPGAGRRPDDDAAVRRSAPRTTAATSPAWPSWRPSTGWRGCRWAPPRTTRWPRRRARRSCASARRSTSAEPRGTRRSPARAGRPARPAATCPRSSTTSSRAGQPPRVLLGDGQRVRRGRSRRGSRPPASGTSSSLEPLQPVERRRARDHAQGVGHRARGARWRSMRWRVASRAASRKRSGSVVAARALHERLDVPVARARRPARPSASRSSASAGAPAKAGVICTSARTRSGCSSAKRHRAWRRPSSCPTSTGALEPERRRAPRRGRPPGRRTRRRRVRRRSRTRRGRGRRRPISA